MFHNRFALALALAGNLSVVPAVAHAQQQMQQQVARGPVPAWVQLPDPIPAPANPRGVIFVTRNLTQMHLTHDGQQSFSNLRAILLNANALQLGNLAVTWNPAAGTPTIHMVKIHRDGEEIDVLENSEFEVLRREDQLETATLDGLLTAVLRVPDLRIGDELEWAYTIPASDPTFKETDFGLMTLAADPAPGRFDFRLSWDEGEEPHTKLSNDFAEIVSEDGESLALHLEMPGPINAPRDAPPRYLWKRVLEYSDFDSWQVVSARLDGLFKEASTLAPDSPVRSEAERIARNNETMLERAAAALELVQQQVRYIYVGLNGGNMTPASADETWERRYGDCKGKTALLLALLGELGIEAEAVAVNNTGFDDGIDERLPNPAMFNHVLVRATLDGEDYWLDGTLPPVAIPSTRPVNPYRWVLPINAEGGDLERIEFAADPIPRNITLYEIDASGGFDVSAQISQTTITRGQDALLEFLQFSSVTDAQLENAYRNNLAGSNFWDTVDTVTWRFDKEQQASILEIAGTGPVDWDDGSNGRKSLSLPGGGFSPPNRRQRSGEQDQDAPFWQEGDFDCHVTTVRIPNDTAPANWSHNSTFNNLFYGAIYSRAFSMSDNEITMRRTRVVLGDEISATTAQRDNARLSDFDNSMAWIYFDPEDDNEPDIEKAIPATHEVDWLTDASACYPQVARAW